jgi:hypothetical protein
MPNVDTKGRNYVTLRSVIDDYIITLDGDDYVSNVSDAALRNIALRGIREFGFDVSSRVKSLKLSVDSTNNTVALPADYVDIVKLGVVGGDGILYVMGHNKNLNYSMKIKTGVDDPLTDDIDESLPTTEDFDDTPLNIDANSVNDLEDSKSGTGDASSSDYDFYIFENYIFQGGIGRMYGLGGGHLRGEYRINLDQNRIEISTDSGTSEVVLEYIADEARSGNPVIHVYAEEALRCYIYYKLCERKASVPANEKARARAEYYNERRKAKARLSNFSKEEALKTIRQNFKMAPKY